MKIILGPVVSEKSTNVGEKNNQVVLKVTTCANKHEVKAAVEYLFSVKVGHVNILNVKGKSKRTGQIQGRRKSWKKAYISLQAGHDISFANP